MNVLREIIEHAKSLKKRIVLPESLDERILEAARRLKDEGVVEPLLFGKRCAVEAKAKEIGLHIDDIEVYDPDAFEETEDFVRTYMELRKKENLTFDQARELFDNGLYFGAMLVRKNFADGMVAGSINTTGNVLRAGIKIIKVAEGCKVVSSCFIMIVPDCELGDDGLFLFADCAVVPDPSAEQMADIAISTAKTGKAVLGMTPRVAMLSFSSHGSAKHAMVDKVKEATAIAREKAPDMIIDGELQADAAIIASVARKKTPDSSLAGNANILIFPSLNVGNICYKLVQRLAKAEAIGPIVQGLAKPVNDLSRGCSANDVYALAAITADIANP